MGIPSPWRYWVVVAIWMAWQLQEPHVTPEILIGSMNTVTTGPIDDVSVVVAMRAITVWPAIGVIDRLELKGKGNLTKSRGNNGRQERRSLRLQNWTPRNRS